MLRPHWNRIATFLIWLLAAICCVFWALKFVRGSAVPLSAAVAAPSAGSGGIDAQALAKGLGGGAAPSSNTAAEAAPTPSALQVARFVLTGVVVQKAGAGKGVALIAVDGKPPRPYRVGTVLADGVVLHSVSPGKAMLSSGADAAPALTLELPRLTTAMVGTAVAARPPMPSIPAAVPAPITAPSATAAANPMAVPGAAGQRPTRPLANRQREAEKE